MAGSELAVCWSPAGFAGDCGGWLFYRQPLYCGGGVRVEKEAVLGANVVLTQSTRIIDVNGSEPKNTKAGCRPGKVVIRVVTPKIPGWGLWGQLRPDHWGAQAQYGPENKFK